MTRRSDELFSKKELYERTMYSFEFILSLIAVSYTHLTLPTIYSV